MGVSYSLLIRPTNRVLVSLHGDQCKCTECNGGLLPDIILLTLCDSIGEPF